MTYNNEKAYHVFYEHLGKQRKNILSDLFFVLEISTVHMSNVHVGHRSDNFFFLFRLASQLKFCKVSTVQMFMLAISKMRTTQNWKIIPIIKFMFFKKTTKIDEIFTVDLTLCSKRQINGEDFLNFHGILRKYEL